jgi:hypothetical protein
MTFLRFPFAQNPFLLSVIVQRPNKSGVYSTVDVVTTVTGVAGITGVTGALANVRPATNEDNKFVIFFVFFKLSIDLQTLRPRSLI